MHLKNKLHIIWCQYHGIYGLKEIASYMVIYRQYCSMVRVINKLLFQPFDFIKTHSQKKKKLLNIIYTTISVYRLEINIMCMESLQTCESGLETVQIQCIHTSPLYVAVWFLFYFQKLSVFTPKTCMYFVNHCL